MKRLATHLTEVLEPPQERLAPFLGGEDILLGGFPVGPCIRAERRARLRHIWELVRVRSAGGVGEQSRIPAVRVNIEHRRMP